MSDATFHFARDAATACASHLIAPTPKYAVSGPSRFCRLYEFAAR
jgi:hypothetical protein